MREITLDATIENIAEVTAFVDEQLEKVECPVKVQMQINICIDELFGNIAHYAYPEGVGKATVQFKMQDEPKMAVLTFIDSGIPYNPLEKEDPDITLALEDRAVGGLGIFMVKKSVDEIFYEYREGENILTIKKRL